MQVSDVEVRLEAFHGSRHLTSLILKIWAFKFYWCMCSQVFIFANLLWLLIHLSSQDAKAGHLAVNGSILIDKLGEGDIVNRFSVRHRNSLALQLSEKRISPHLLVLAQFMSCWGIAIPTPLTECEKLVLQFCWKMKGVGVVWKKQRKSGTMA